MPDPRIGQLIRRWLEYAHVDLSAAETLHASSASGMDQIVCFHAQQAAEKALKAVFVADQMEFPFVHDLGRLAEALPRAIALPERTALDWLTEFAVEGRYPRPPGVSGADPDAALTIARETLAAVESALRDGD